MRTSHLVLVLIAAGCTSPQGTYVTPAELAVMEAAADDASFAGSRNSGGSAPGPLGASGRVPLVMPGDDPDAEQAEKDREKLEDRTVKLERRRQDLDRAGPALETRLSSLTLEQESQMASEAVAIAKAESEHRIAVEDLAHYVEVEQVRRLAEEALSMQGSSDRLLETREELAQLEMMYGESGLGDATAEIVLSRTRRRLARAEEGHRLRAERSEELVSIEIPREIEERELAVSSAEVELANARRKAERGHLDRAAAVTKLEKEQIELDREAEDIVLEAMRIERDLARLDLGSRLPAPMLALSGAVGAAR